MKRITALLGLVVCPFLLWAQGAPARIALDSASRAESKGLALDSSKATVLKGAVVTASKRVVRQEIDRISYDVQADPDAKANDALEMLRKVPMVTVDANDVVQLKGSSNFQIFINGKPSALMVASPSDVLKAMPAATIQKIEVITVPPSKYDGEGLAGIINIITLKPNTDGVTGSLFARYNSVFGERGSASINVSKGRLSLTSLLGIGREPMVGAGIGSQLIEFSPASTLSQQGQQSARENFNNGKLDLNYELDSGREVIVSADFYNKHYTQVTSTFSSLMYAPDSMARSYGLRNAGPLTAGAFDVSLGYQVRLGQSKGGIGRSDARTGRSDAGLGRSHADIAGAKGGPGQSDAGFGRSDAGVLNLSYRYASTKNTQGNTVTVSDGYNYSGGDYTQSNRMQTSAHNFELGLVRPMGRLVVEAGAKAIVGTNDSYSEFGTEVNDFSYHQDIYSLYNSYHLKLSAWKIKAGARLENTVISSSYSHTQTPIDQKYVNLLPTASVQWNLAANNSLTLGITERMQRATAAELNPFVDRSNPAFVVTGNPALRAVVNHIIQLDYSRGARLAINASVDYTFSSDPIQNVIELAGDTVSESSYENVGRNQSAGVHLTVNYPLFSKLNFVVNSQLSHLWLSGVYGSQLYKNDGEVGNVAASARYSFAHELTASVNYNYKSGNVYLQGKTSSYTYVGFNIIKEFWGRRGTLSITAFSPWRKFTAYSTRTVTRDFAQYSYSEYFDRNFRFAFNYKLGRIKPGRVLRGDEE